MPTGVLPSFSAGLVSTDNLTAAVSRRKMQVEDAAAAGKSGAERDAKLQKACQGFEAIFLNVILQEMRKSIPEDGLLPTSNASRTWQQLFDNQLAENLASRQEMGVAKMLYQQLQGMEGGKK
ncbi:MAG: rod-binding protein [Deltaproteobacteria bacterium]|nr:rod-binding protein [Deltaproteobacteria bacterium]